MKRAEILTGLWLLMFLIYGKECMSQIQNKVCDTIPYELVHNKIIIPVTIKRREIMSINIFEIFFIFTASKHT